MKQLVTFLFILTLVLGFFLQAHAALELRGTDINGNRLIYDSYLNITWYDYTRTYDTWQNQMDWADGLDVDFGGNHYTDWRLPSTVDDPWVYGYDGTTTAGYNITSSEMGHLFYTELGNTGAYDKSGNLTGCSGSPPFYCLTNTGDFQNLQPAFYWSGTEYAADPDGTWGSGDAWNFDAYFGNQSTDGHRGNDFTYAIAVRSGDVSVVPEPISAILFLTGGATLIGRKYIKTAYNN